jgi:hypothetical protein
MRDWSVLKRLGSFFALALMSLTAGCGPDISGTVGISVTKSGEVLGISKGCGKEFDGAILFRAGHEANLARWELAPKARGSETFVWQITGAVRDRRFAANPTVPKDSLDSAAHYTLRVGTADPNVVIGDADFTGADLDGLRPGSVLIADLAKWNTEKQEYPPTMTVSRKKFARIACSDDYRFAD